MHSKSSRAEFLSICIAIIYCARDVRPMSYRVMPSVTERSFFGALYTTTAAKITISVHYWSKISVHAKFKKKCTLLLSSTVCKCYNYHIHVLTHSSRNDPEYNMVINMKYYM